MLVRTDKLIAFRWEAGSPGDGVPVDRFMARWTGYLTPPDVAGDYFFGAKQDDGVVATVDGTKVVDKWSPTSFSETILWGSTSKQLTAVPKLFKLEYYEDGGAAGVELWAKLGANGTPFQVPASWFTKSVEVLPDGWASSTILAGGDLARTPRFGLRRVRLP